MHQCISKAFVFAQHGQQVKPAWARVFKIMQGGRGHDNKVSTAAADGSILEVKDHLAAQDKEQFSRLVVGMGRNPITGVVDL